jgi:hypothetical protein
MFSGNAEKTVKGGMAMSRLTTSGTVQRNVNAIFGRTPLVKDFDTFIEDPASMRIVQKSFDTAKYVLSRLSTRVPKAMHWDAMNMYGKLKAYTIEDYKQDIRFALMNRWYIKLSHTFTSSQGAPRLAENDAIYIHNLLVGKDEVVIRDLKEVSFEVAKQVVHYFIDGMLCNLVAPITPDWLKDE